MSLSFFDETKLNGLVQRLLIHVGHPTLVVTPHLKVITRLFHLKKLTWLELVPAKRVGEPYSIFLVHNAIIAARPKEVPIRFRPRKPKAPTNHGPMLTVNEQIRAPELRLIDEKGGQIGIVSREAALRMAEEEEKDLVLIAAQANPPVVKLIDISKHKYQLQEKQKETGKANRGANSIKELRLTPFIAAGDLDARINRAREFLEDGFKVRFFVRFKGREITKKEFGEQVITKVFQALAEVSTIEIAPKMEGRNMTAQLMPKKK